MAPRATCQGQTTCGFCGSTCLRKPQRRNPATQAPQESCLKGRSLRYRLPLPLVKATKIPNILIAPMNIQKQNTINEYGRIVPKDRLTHNQSFEWLSGTFVNSWVITEELLPCMFGSCIRRIVNLAVTACCLYPNFLILASKIDYKSTF